MLMISLQGDGPAATTSSNYSELIAIPRSESPTEIGSNLSVNVPDIRVDSGPPSSVGNNSPDLGEHRASTSTTALLLLTPAMAPRSASSSSDVRRAARIPLPLDSVDEVDKIPRSGLRPALRANTPGSSKVQRKSVNFGSSNDTTGPPAPPDAVLARPDSAADAPGVDASPIIDTDTDDIIMQGTFSRSHRLADSQFHTSRRSHVSPGIIFRS